ncbi:MAG: hypothetical protein HOV83_19340, partial [Catenulispora sp.]|nr:hypothetical protein [Catenulispora sp.]
MRLLRCLAALGIAAPLCVVAGQTPALASAPGAGPAAGPGFPGADWGRAVLGPSDGWAAA